MKSAVAPKLLHLWPWAKIGRRCPSPVSTLRFLASLEALNGSVPSFPQYSIDPLHDEVVNLGPLLEGDLPERLIDWLRKVETGMDYSRTLQRPRTGARVVSLRHIAPATA
jgi:hypothetical protein